MDKRDLLLGGKVKVRSIMIRLPSVSLIDLDKTSTWRADLHAVTDRDGDLINCSSSQSACSVTSTSGARMWHVSPSHAAGVIFLVDK